MFLVPAIGTQGCERVLIVLSVVSALFALAPPLRAKAGVLCWPPPWWPPFSWP